MEVGDSQHVPACDLQALAAFLAEVMPLPTVLDDDISGGRNMSEGEDHVDNHMSPE